MKTIARVLSFVMWMIALSLVLEAGLQADMDAYLVVMKMLQAIILAIAGLIIWGLGDG